MQGKQDLPHAGLVWGGQAQLEQRARGERGRRWQRAAWPLARTPPPCPLKTALSPQVLREPRSIQAPLYDTGTTHRERVSPSPSSARKPRLCILGGHIWARKKPRTHAWQTTSNAALGLLVSLCWLKLLLASALAFNFSPLNHHVAMPMVVFSTGIQTVSAGREPRKWVLFWPPSPTRTHWGSAGWPLPPPQDLAHHWREDPDPSPVRATMWEPSELLGKDSGHKRGGSPKI